MDLCKKIQWNGVEVDASCGTATLSLVAPVDSRTPIDYAALLVAEEKAAADKKAAEE